MQVHSLDFDDFEEDNYLLIGVHTTLEDYKFAYLLNRELKTGFVKEAKSEGSEKKKDNISFSLYKYSNITYDLEWFLIANSYKEYKKEQTGLLLNSETKNYLVPEKKNIDFFIKIIGESDQEFMTHTIRKIKNIQQVITSYSINPDTLKSKEFLIF